MLKATLLSYIWQRLMFIGKMTHKILDNEQQIRRKGEYEKKGSVDKFVGK